MRLLISNLNKHTTVSHLVSLLLPFGLVSSAKLTVNNENGRSNGIALVEIERLAGLMAMRELNDMQFMNFYIQVEEVMAGR